MELVYTSTERAPFAEGVLPKYCLTVTEEMREDYSDFNVFVVPDKYIHKVSGFCLIFCKNVEVGGPAVVLRGFKQLQECKNFLANEYPEIIQKLRLFYFAAIVHPFVGEGYPGVVAECWESERPGAIDVPLVNELSYNPSSRKHVWLRKPLAQVFPIKGDGTNPKLEDLTYTLIASGDTGPDYYDGVVFTYNEVDVYIQKRGPVPMDSHWADVHAEFVVWCLENQATSTLTKDLLPYVVTVTPVKKSEPDSELEWSTITSTVKTDDSCITFSLEYTHDKYKPWVLKVEGVTGTVITLGPFERVPDAKSYAKWALRSLQNMADGYVTIEGT